MHYLRERGFEGEEYELFAGKLLEDGYATIKPWIASGRMAREATRRGRVVGRLPRGTTEADIHELATDTVYAALKMYRRLALVEARWQPDRGATLLSYFLGACVQVYPGCHRRWLREQQRWWHLTTASEQLLNPCAAASRMP